MTVNQVTDGAPEFSAYADFLDGETPVVHRVALSLDESVGRGDLILSLPGREDLRWPLDTLRTVRDPAADDILVLAQDGGGLARLMVADNDARRVLASRAPMMGRGPYVPGAGRLLGWATAALAAVAVIVFLLVPLLADQMARFLPREGERALGEATFEQIRNALGTEFFPVDVCESSEGLEALAAMQSRLVAAGGLDVGLTVRVLDHDLINAFALPGGQVILFRGLIDAAESPEEVAAVLAHEIGHVVARDPTRLALRTAGSAGVIGLLFGDFSGGTAAVFVVEWLLQANYSRAAETAADDFAIDLLQKADLPPAALATMFERLLDEYGEAPGIVRHFNTHPEMAGRIARSGGIEVQGGQPVLTTRQWRQLRDICGAAPGRRLPQL